MWIPAAPPQGPNYTFFRGSAHAMKLTNGLATTVGIAAAILAVAALAAFLPDLVHASSDAAAKAAEVAATDEAIV